MSELSLSPTTRKRRAPIAQSSMQLSAIEREASFEILFESNPIPMFVYDWKSLQVIAANDAAIAHYGFTREQCMAMSILDFRPPEDRAQARLAVQSAEGGNNGSWPARHIKADGQMIDVVVHSRPLRLAAHSVAVAAIHDVTSQKRAEHMARHDALTGLPNRIVFHERIGQALSARRHVERRFAVLCLGLDGLKQINESAGHAVGDALLRAFAERLRSLFGGKDTIARIGTDRFAALQFGAMPDSLLALAQRLLKAAAEPYNIDGKKIALTSSVGAAMSRGADCDPDDLCREADQALYRARQEGGNNYRIFDYEMSAGIRRRKALELDLRNALLRDEFELFYQPLISLADDRVCGVEALLRWRHPKRGVILPARFIPIAEESGAIADIGEWVLNRACADAASWPDRITVAVNLSPLQFKAGNLGDVVAAALTASGLPASRLELEITEGVSLQNSDATTGLLHQFGKLGVKISLDDFGTGYSSLSYLLRFPFDKVKIDQSFVRGLPNDANALAIVRAITGLGANMGIAMAAEGVETEEQLQLLRTLGCTEVQGYLFSHPKPAQEVVELFGRRPVPPAATSARR